METHNAQYSTNEYNNETSTHSALCLNAISWRAILAGAVTATALSLILLLLGTGLGLSAVSPWTHSGVSGSTFSFSTILWITITSIFASGLGGYISGRLRTRWVSTQIDEVHFRDTAHGFLAWALATLLTATLLASVISSLVTGTAQTGVALTSASIVAAGSSVEPDNKSMPYFIDSMFRKEINANSVVNGNNSNSLTESSSTGVNSSKTEVTRILMNAFSISKLSAEDTRYAGQLISQQTNLSQQEAEKRVTDTFNILQAKMNEAEIAAKTAANQVRKASAYGSLWLFISLLIGAFIASLMAVHGGRQRDL